MRELDRECQQIQDGQVKTKDLKLLFLDFDGPLFPYRYIKYHAKQREKYPGKLGLPDIVDYWVMDPLSVEMLNFLYDLYPFKTVVSSSWRHFLTEPQCRELFEINGLNLQLATPWLTPTVSIKSDSYTRSLEIKEYIENARPSDFIILDDYDSGGAVDLHFDKADREGKVVLLDADYGIDSYNYKKLLHNVKLWAGLKSDGFEKD